MNEQKTLKPIREVLRSPRFQKEISILLIAFAVSQAVVAILLFIGGGSDPENVVIVIVALMTAVVFVVLAILIRSGSMSALLFTGILFTADTLLTLFSPLWQGSLGVLFWRGFLIVLLIRFIQRARRANIADPKLTNLEESCKVD